MKWNSIKDGLKAAPWVAVALSATILVGASKCQVGGQSSTSQNRSGWCDTIASAASDCASEEPASDYGSWSCSDSNQCIWLEDDEPVDSSSPFSDSPTSLDIDRVSADVAVFQDGDVVEISVDAEGRTTVFTLESPHVLRAVINGGEGPQSAEFVFGCSTEYCAALVEDYAESDEVSGRVFDRTMYPWNVFAFEFAQYAADCDPALKNFADMLAVAARASSSAPGVEVGGDDALTPDEVSTETSNDEDARGGSNDGSTGGAHGEGGDDSEEVDCTVMDNEPDTGAAWKGEADIFNTVVLSGEIAKLDLDSLCYQGPPTRCQGYVSSVATGRLEVVNAPDNSAVDEGYACKKISASEMKSVGSHTVQLCSPGRQDEGTAVDLKLSITNGVDVKMAAFTRKGNMATSAESSISWLSGGGCERGGFWRQDASHGWMSRGDALVRFN